MITDWKLSANTNHWYKAYEKSLYLTTTTFYVCDIQNGTEVSKGQEWEKLYILYIY